MYGQAKAFRVRTKTWIVDEDEKVVFGMGRYRILDAVRRNGSLQGAARELKMSYRAVWCRIKASEDRVGQPLVVRMGKGSRLTPFAEKLMKHFKRLNQIVAAESNEVFASLCDPHLIGE